MARQSLKLHHLSLLRRLNASLASLKDTQNETYRHLPQPEPFKETPQFQACNTIADITAVLGDDISKTQNVSPITLLRCGIMDFGKGKEGDLMKPNTTELFQHMEGQIPWLVSEEGLQYEVRFYQRKLSH